MNKTSTIRRISLLALTVAMLLSLTIPCMASEVEAINEARNGVVRVLAISEDQTTAGVGSGFGVGDAGEETQYFVTNWHVVADDNGAVGNLDIYILLDNDAFTIDAEGWHLDYSRMIPCDIIYAADQYPDVAILKAERKVPGRVALTLRSAREVLPGEQAYVVGYPATGDNSAILPDFSGQYLYADVDSVQVNAGAVSKHVTYGPAGDTMCLQHDAHGSNGNSGGPLMDKNGNVIGIHTYSDIDDDFIEFAVYIDYAMDILNELDIAYDYVGMEPEFPVVPVAVGLAVAAVLAVLVVISRKKRPAAPQAPVDTGLRVQYDPTAALSGKRYVINGTLRFGRAPDCNILYPGSTPGISSHHCEILVENGQVFIRDLNSSHGTFVNGSRIPSNQSIPLNVGARVSLGSVKESFQIVRSTRM